MSAVLVRDPGLRRPPIEVELVETGWKPWFEWAEYSHYLVGAKPLPFSTAFTGFEVSSGDPVFFIGLTGMWAGQRRVARVCRMVTHPEWQGAGIGMRCMDAIAEREWRGEGFIGAPVPTYQHTAHPALVSAMRRSPRWRQVSQKLVGGEGHRIKGDVKMQYGGHLRAVAGFRYLGPEAK